MNRFKLVFVLISLLVAGSAIGQSKINSPYSRYGLGILHGKNVNASTRGMGGVSIAMSDATMVNPNNPSSYAVFDSLAFVFEGGIVGNYTTLTTNTISETTNNATLSYILTGFPVNKWWKTSLGLMPFSEIGYNVDLTIDMSEYEFSDIVNEFIGEGGISRVYWGNAFKISDNFRVGIDASYLFGNGNRSSRILFVDSLNIYGTKVETNTKVSGFIFDYGLQYDIKLKNNNILTLGATYANNFNINGTRDYISKTITGGYNDIVEETNDTIEYRPGETGKVLVPMKAGFGAVFKGGQQWLVGADIEWQKWSDFSAFDTQDTLLNTMRLALGGEYTPKHTSISSLFKRMTYRAGLRYEQSYLKVNGNQINEFGISFGGSFPMKKSKTTLDLGIEFGRRGTLNNNLVQENFINVNFGVSIQESWFYKRKYN